MTGDLHVMKGALSRYEITGWSYPDGSKSFVLVVKPSIGGDKTIGEYTSLSNARRAAKSYDKRFTKREGGGGE